eukprot:482105_1
MESNFKAETNDIRLENEPIYKVQIQYIQLCTCDAAFLYDFTERYIKCELVRITVTMQKRNDTVCRYYGSAAGCNYGDKCRYDHSNPNSVPLCRFYRNCRNGNKCNFRHNKCQNDVQSTFDEFSLTKHEILIHGFIRELKTIQIVPIEIVCICKKYCNSIIPALIRTVQPKTFRLSLIEAKINEFCCDVLNMNKHTSVTVSTAILFKYSNIDNSIKDELYDMFYDETNNLRKLALKIKFRQDIYANTDYNERDRIIAQKLRPKVEPIYNLMVKQHVYKNMLFHVSINRVLACLMVYSDRNTICDIIMDDNNDVLLEKLIDIFKKLAQDSDQLTAYKVKANMIKLALDMDDLLKAQMMYTDLLT